MSEKQRGLGRGLSALLAELPPVQPETVVTDSGAEMKVGVETPIELLVRNPDQPRRQFIEADIEELAQSIREKGVLQPILVRPAPGHAGHYQIIAGERRWRAAQRAGLHAVPVIVRDFDDLETLEIGIVENVQRADLNAIEEARAYKTLMDRFGRTQDAVAQVVGKSRSHIANSLRLLQLPDSVQDHVLKGRLSAGHARALVGRENAESVADQVISKGLSVRQVEALTRVEPRHSAEAASAKPQTPDVLALERQLSEATGAAVKLSPKGDGGEIRLTYRSLEQLDDICRRLSRL